MVPAKMPHGVDVEMTDGTVRSAEVLDSLGTPERPLSDEGVARKARALLATVDPGIDLDGIIATVDSLPELDDIATLAGLLMVPGYGTRKAAAAE